MDFKMDNGTPKFPRGTILGLESALSGHCSDGDESCARGPAMSLLAPSNGTSHIWFSSMKRREAGFIRYSHASGNDDQSSISFGIQKTERDGDGNQGVFKVVLNSMGRMGIGSSVTPTVTAPPTSESDAALAFPGGLVHIKSESGRDKFVDDGSERDLLVESSTPNIQLLGQALSPLSGLSSSLSFTKIRELPAVPAKKRNAKPAEAVPIMADHWSIAQLGDEGGGSLAIISSSGKAQQNPLDISLNEADTLLKLSRSGSVIIGSKRRDDQALSESVSYNVELSVLGRTFANAMFELAEDDFMKQVGTESKHNDQKNNHRNHQTKPKSIGTESDTGTVEREKLEALKGLKGRHFLWDNAAKGQKVAESNLDPGMQYGLSADTVEAVLPTAVVTDKAGVRWVRNSVITTLLVDALNELAQVVEVSSEKHVESVEQTNTKVEEGSKQLHEFDKQMEGVVEELRTKVLADALDIRTGLADVTTELTAALADKVDGLRISVEDSLGLKATLKEMEELQSRTDTLEDTFQAKVALLETTKCTIAEVDGLQARADQLEESLEGMGALQDRLDKLEVEAANLRRTIEDERRVYESKLSTLQANLELEIAKMAITPSAANSVDDDSNLASNLFLEKLSELKRDWDASLNPSMLSTQRIKQWNLVKESKRSEAFRAVEEHIEDVRAFKKLWGGKKQK
jgi:hypothetical protein